MRTYQVTRSWKRIASNASEALLTIEGRVRVYKGGTSTPSNGSGTIVDGPAALQFWDVADRGGCIWVKGSGSVRAMADGKASLAASESGVAAPKPPVADAPGVYTATNSWVRIANSITAASVESLGDVQVFTGDWKPSESEAGVALSGGGGLHLWNVPGRKLFIKGSGQVRLLASPTSSAA
ncbi:MAG: hypothetical protein OIF40_14765 [Mangrovicoccus sp.]|nr:hypothetical protein [Mangrovicoccus sp.]